MEAKIKHNIQEVKRLIPDDAKVKAVILEATGEAIRHAHETVPSYPPDRGYRRTGTLGRSLHTSVNSFGGAAVGSLGSPVAYSPYVIGQKLQATIHQGFWYTLEGVLAKALPRIKEIYLKLVAAAFRR